MVHLSPLKVLRQIYPTDLLNFSSLMGSTYDSLTVIQDQFEATGIPLARRENALGWEFLRVRNKLHSSQVGAQMMANVGLPESLDEFSGHYRALVKDVSQTFRKLTALQGFAPLIDAASYESLENIIGMARLYIRTLSAHLMVCDGVALKDAVLNCSNLDVFPELFCPVP